MKQEFNNLVKDLQKRNDDNKNRARELTDQQTVVRSLDLVQRAVVQSISILVQTLLEDTQKTKVVNMPELAINATDEIVKATDLVRQTIADKNIDLSGVLTHLEGIHDVLGKLPTQYPQMPEMPSEMAVNNLGELCDKLDAIGIEIQNLKLDPKIDINPEVKLDLSKEIKQIEKAVKSISVTVPEQKATDIKPLVQAMNSVKKTIENIQFPVPNFRTQDIVDAIENISINVDNITVSSFSDSGGTDRKALVDGDRHVQVDVLTAPPVTVDTTGLATDTKQDTIITELQAIEANQLPDGHNVTVDNLPSEYPLPSSQISTLTPQTNALTDTQLRATPVPVSGTLSVDTTGLATEAKQDTIIGHIDGVETLIGTTNTTLGTIDSDTGSIAVSTSYLDDWNGQVGQAHINYGVTVLGSDGTNSRRLKTDTDGNLQVDVLSGTQTDALTDTQLRATPVPVSGTISTGLTQPLTDAQLRATAVPVSGTVTANTGLTQPTTPSDTQPVSASSLPLPTGASTSAKQDDALAQLKQIRGFDIPEYDEIDLAYTGDNLTSVVYKNSSSTVATLTLAYTGDKLVNVVIS
jgi:hypothetical protein